MGSVTSLSRPPPVLTKLTRFPTRGLSARRPPLSRRLWFSRRLSPVGRLLFHKCLRLYHLLLSQLLQIRRLRNRPLSLRTKLFFRHLLLNKRPSVLTEPSSPKSLLPMLKQQRSLCESSRLPRSRCWSLPRLRWNSSIGIGPKTILPVAVQMTTTVLRTPMAIAATRRELKLQFLLLL